MDLETVAVAHKKNPAPPCERASPPAAADDMGAEQSAPAAKAAVVRLKTADATRWPKLLARDFAASARGPRLGMELRWRTERRVRVAARSACIVGGH